MPTPPASRRRIRPALAAAVGCGVLGGSLVGLGAFGFDKVEVAAASCVDSGTSSTPAATPVPTSSNPAAGGDLVTGQPVSEMSAKEASKLSATNEAALADVPVTKVGARRYVAGPLGDDTTISPTIGARKPICEPVDETPVVNIPDPAPSPTVEPGGSDVPSDEPGDSTDPDDTASDPTPTPAPTVAPTPIPGDDEPVVPTPQPTVKPTPLPNVPSSDPVIPAPSTSTRGYSTSGRPSSPTPGRTGTISRIEAIARGVSWVTQAVPYSQVRWWNDANGVFRQDCSGFVSMAWRTDQRVNYWTGNLGTISDRIPSSSLQPGDALLLPGKHVILFVGWANAQKTKFHLMEEYRTGYPARLVRNASLSYYLDRGFGAYSYDGIRDVAATVTEPLSTPAAPVVTPDPTPVPQTQSTTRRETVTLLSASSSSAADTAASTAETQAWTIEQAIAGLPATDWTPGVAESYVPEEDALGAVAPDASSTELSLAQTPVEDLVSAQSAVDQAEEQRLASVTRNALMSSENRTSNAGLILAAGLGLLFVAIPLGAASRRSWAANSPAAPAAPGTESD